MNNMILNKQFKITVINIPKYRLLGFMVKRNMMQRTRDILFRGVYYGTGTRPFATVTEWSGKMRVKPAQPSAPANATYYDKQTGYEIMPEIDTAKVNHMYLVDKTYRSDDYYLVVGSFTSTNKPINGIEPEKISDTLFNGKNKPQFFIRFQQPKVIPKEFVKPAKYDVFDTALNENLKTKEHEVFVSTVNPVDQDMY